MKMENEWFLCLCKECKHQKHCLLHVLETYVQKWGRFELLREKMGAIIRGEVVPRKEALIYVLELRVLGWPID